MKTKTTKQASWSVGDDFFNRIQEDGYAYIKTVLDVIHEPVLVLDRDLYVIAANDPFCAKFQVDRKDTEKKIIYELGNGQWNIPALRKLLEEVIPTDTSFKGFEVIHEFPQIGRKIMLLNGRQIYFKNDSTFPSIILLAIEDMSEMMAVADKLTKHIASLQTKLADRTGDIEDQMSTLQKEIAKLKKK